MGFKSIRVAIFYAGLPKSNATLLLYPGLGPAMLRRLRRESLPVNIGGVVLFYFTNKTLEIDKSFIYCTIITPPMLTGRLSLLSRLNIAGPKPG